jgi:hypothetical protein
LHEGAQGSGQQGFGAQGFGQQGFGHGFGHGSQQGSRSQQQLVKTNAVANNATADAKVFIIYSLKVLFFPDDGLDSQAPYH